MPADLQAQLGTALGDRYQVTREIGRGGMAIVFEGIDRRDSRPVAIKVLREEVAGGVGVSRFLQEMQIERRLQHPNILPLLDSGQFGDVPFCVLPLVEGPSLRDRLRKEGQLPIADALRIATEVANALAHAHADGIVHRDVKPENILLSGDRVILADFGIARAVTSAATDRFTSTGVVVGTPTYMSPEQASGSGTLDGRSDLYSLGIVVYEMLAGEPPFSGRTADVVIAKHRLQPPTPLRTLRATVPEPVADAVARVLAKSPADRFATATEFVGALHAPAKWRPWRSRRVRAVAALGAGAAALAVWRAWPAPVLDASAVAVYPVRDPSRVSSGDALTDEVAYAIEVALDHARPLRWLHGWDWLAEDVRSDPVRLDGGLQARLARSHRVRYFIDGVIQRSATETSVVLRLHDVAADSVVAAESASAASGADLATLGLEATQKLLVRWMAPGRSADLQPLRSVTPAALALLLQGEREYRSARFARALTFYERAVQEDSTFAYAAVKAAQSASWLNLLERAQVFAASAVRHEARLPAQYRPFALGLHDYLTGRSDSAVLHLTNALRIAPDWDEAHMALADVYYHLMPRAAHLDSLALGEFSSAMARDEEFTPPLTHLAEITARAGDQRRFDILVDRIRAVGADPLWARSLGIMRECLRNAESTRWDQVASEDVTATLGATKAFVVGMAQPRCAIAGANALLRLRDNEGARWNAFLVRHGIFMAEGRYQDALAALDSARTAGNSNVIYLYLLGAFAGAPFDSAAANSIRFARSVYGESYERANPTGADGRGASALWIVGAWHARQGDTALARDIDDRLQAAAREHPERRRLSLISRAVSAHLALARRDTARAIAQFGALTSTARRDSLTWDHFEALATERDLLARLLLAKRQFVLALDAASSFDHQEPVSFVPFLPRSLRIRAEAADSLRQTRLATQYRERLRELTRVR